MPKGDEVIAVANRLSPQYELVVATQDWHPADHASFASQHPGKKPGDTVDLNGVEQILWPDHCVQNTPGAAFAPGFDRSRVAAVFHKGIDREIDSYSGFFRQWPSPEHRSGRVGSRPRVWMRSMSPAWRPTYCVKFSALDAIKAGFKTHIILEGCRGVELAPGDIEKAIHEMKAAGVNIE